MYVCMYVCVYVCVHFELTYTRNEHILGRKLSICRVLLKRERERERVYEARQTNNRAKEAHLMNNRRPFSHFFHYFLQG